MAKHRNWHSADIKRALKKKLKAAKRKAQKI
jgi:lambda repressor-like predicted transcriptional regulator